MSRQRQRPLPAKPATKKSSQNDIFDSTGLIVKSDLQGEDSWVLIKKQRVTILVPPLPVDKTSAQQKDALPVLLDLLDSKQEGAPAETDPTRKLINEQEQFAKADSRNESNVDSRVPEQCLLVTPIQPMTNEDRTRSRAKAMKRPMIKQACNLSKANKQPKLVSSLSIIDGNRLLNQRLRALNLESELQKAGGLSRWLVSMGLGQFVSVFQGRQIGKYQLVSLTMEKLKAMGATAVGPRRKLINAIECICQPHSLIDSQKPILRV